MKLENLEFGKYHGLGNDYIIIDDITLNIPEENKSLLARKLCEFHFSIGADGLIFVCASKDADIKMRIFNNDGTEAEMCGNGIRCFSKYVYEKNFVKKDEIKIETLKGIMIAKLSITNSIVRSVEIDMGPPILDCDEIPVILDSKVDRCVNEPLVVLDKIFNFTAVSMGNPHVVIFIEEQLDDEKLNMYGAAIESNSHFPNKTNVEFVKIISKEESILRVFERGVGITKSCGTGACASVVAGSILGLFNKNVPIIVHNDGGDLKIRYTGRTIFMEGPVEKVFEGIIESIEI
ncbi:MAG: diaminopimelate epimerase [Candidatus Odinarchaeota archaeon]